MHQKQSPNIIKAIKVGLVSLTLYITSLDFEMLMIWSTIAFIDVIVGTIVSMKEGKYNSKTMSNGLINKVLEFFLLIAVVFAQRALQKLGFNLPASTIIFGAFIVKDVGSIIETLIAGGLALPKKITDWFEIADKKINNSK